MSRSDDQRLGDIAEAAARIRRIVARGTSAFKNDDAVQLAIERLLEVIGESANAMSDEGRARIPYVAWDDVRRLRIVLAHHYHRIDPDQVWTIATNDVPNLAKAILDARPDLHSDPL